MPTTWDHKETTPQHRSAGFFILFQHREVKWNILLPQIFQVIHHQLSQFSLAAVSFQGISLPHFTGGIHDNPCNWTPFWTLQTVCRQGLSATLDVMQAPLIPACMPVVIYQPRMGDMQLGKLKIGILALRLVIWMLGLTPAVWFAPVGGTGLQDIICHIEE